MISFEAFQTWSQPNYSLHTPKSTLYSLHFLQVILTLIVHCDQLSQQGFAIFQHNLQFFSTVLIGSEIIKAIGELTEAITLHKMQIIIHFHTGSVAVIQIFKGKKRAFNIPFDNQKVAENA
jgi:hypothetical protein